MITYIRKGKERKELMLSRLEYKDGQCACTFRVLVFPSNKRGNIELTAEHNEIVAGKEAAVITYHRILKGFKDNGWEVEAMK